MAKEKIIECPFYRFMWSFYVANKKEIKKTYTKLTRTILDNAEPSKDNPSSFLRNPQYEAFEMYVFLKEYLGNPRLADLFDAWRNNLNPEEKSVPFTFENTRMYEKDELFNVLDLLNRDTLADFFRQLSDLKQNYANYIFALTMGTGKQFLWRCAFSTNSFWLTNILMMNASVIML